MGEAIAHFQCGVATLQWCRDSRGHGVHGKCVCSHDQRPACACAGEPGKACHDRPPWALCRDREFPVAIEKANPMSR